jgi:hypothetical protein
VHPFCLEPWQGSEEEGAVAGFCRSNAEGIFAEEYGGITAPEMAHSGEEVETGVCTVGALLDGLLDGH